MGLILGIIVLLVLLSCAGWILRVLGVVAKYSLGCLLKGILYLVCAYIIITVFLTMLAAL